MSGIGAYFGFNIAEPPWELRPFPNRRSVILEDRRTGHATRTRLSMTLCCAVLLFTLAPVLISQTARAAELMGFGPIEFGMTKEEAMAALDGRGEWTNGNREGSGYILYDMVIDEQRWVFSVIQHFDDGRATRVSLKDDFDWRSEPNRWIRESGWLTIWNLAACQMMVDRLVSIIWQTYNVEPLSQLNFTTKLRDSNGKPDTSSELYTFAFDDQAYIQVVWQPEEWVSDTGCGLSVKYEPPLGRPIPF